MNITRLFGTLVAFQIPITLGWLGGMELERDPHLAMAVGLGATLAAVQWFVERSFDE